MSEKWFGSFSKLNSEQARIEFYQDWNQRKSSESFPLSLQAITRLEIQLDAFFAPTSFCRVKQNNEYQTWSSDKINRKVNAVLDQTYGKIAFDRLLTSLNIISRYFIESNSLESSIPEWIQTWIAVCSQIRLQRYQDTANSVDLGSEELKG